MLVLWVLQSFFTYELQPELGVLLTEGLAQFNLLRQVLLVELFADPGFFLSVLSLHHQVLLLEHVLFSNSQLLELRGVKFVSHLRSQFLQTLEVDLELLFDRSFFTHVHLDVLVHAVLQQHIGFHILLRQQGCELVHQFIREVLGQDFSTVLLLFGSLTLRHVLEQFANVFLRYFARLLLSVLLSSDLAPQLGLVLVIFDLCHSASFQLLASGIQFCGLNVFLLLQLRRKTSVMFSQLREEGLFLEFNVDFFAHLVQLLSHFLLAFRAILPGNVGCLHRRRVIDWRTIPIQAERAGDDRFLLRALHQHRFELQLERRLDRHGFFLVLSYDIELLDGFDFLLCRGVKFLLRLLLTLGNFLCQS